MRKYNKYHVSVLGAAVLIFASTFGQIWLWQKIWADPISTVVVVPATSTASTATSTSSAASSASTSNNTSASSSTGSGSTSSTGSSTSTSSSSSSSSSRSSSSSSSTSTSSTSTSRGSLFTSRSSTQDVSANDGSATGGFLGTLTASPLFIPIAVCFSFLIFIALVVLFLAISRAQEIKSRKGSGDEFAAFDRVSEGEEDEEEKAPNVEEGSSSDNL